ncbi:biotin-dependent carboxyltransferase family protein [Halobacillus rhizosphaerae]|uniref:5-oxoprolinase subunit C family protein n=1 Tax=Halobacillus rhizosphaerae TaxID=3064889 RepID=UPI00398AB0C6
MIHVKKAGLLTTVQDLGRYGFQKHGVITSGVMDPEAHRIANLLVGNSMQMPTLEVTLMGPVLEFHQDALISICGGHLSPMINGEPVGNWRPIFIKKGSELRFGSMQEGCRAYLAIAGGYDVPLVMNSSSTYLRAGIGGYQGRSLEKGDQLNIQAPSAESLELLSELKEYAGANSFQAMDWYAASELVPSHSPDEKIRVVMGREYDSFTEDSKQAFIHSSFKVDTQSDRMGYRLKGASLELKHQEEMISEAVAFGTIQVPAEGNPIILLADRQTTGGYPRIAQVASVDLSKVAQLKPGEEAAFELITHEEAQKLFIEREHMIQQLAQGIKLKYR